MQCRKFRNLISSKPTFLSAHSYPYHLSRAEKCHWFGNFIASARRSDFPIRMSTAHKFRIILRDFSARRLWSVWSRSCFVSTVFRRCRRDRGVREVFECFRQTFLRPRRTLLLSATAVLNKNDGDDTDDSPPCTQSISDEDLEKLITDLEAIEELSKATLFCTKCGKRLVVDKKHNGITYCSCDKPAEPEGSADGWEPFMEAEDVMIWRKQYKGQASYAYKVYGRYPEISACDFAAIQVDSEYRRDWDDAVASLSVVEEAANGVRDQDVLHWEVIWPRMFANRDYVYMRRHKTFDVRSRRQSHQDCLFTGQARPITTSDVTNDVTATNVHARARRKAREKEQRRIDDANMKENKCFVIVSRSCKHSDVPENKSVVRVREYWSHMVVRTLNGADERGLEYVLTYHESATSGVPAGVSAWATGRAAPQYLRRMRLAARGYQNRDLNKEVSPVPAEAAVIPLDERHKEIKESCEAETLTEPTLTTDKSTQTDAQNVAQTIDRCDEEQQELECSFEKPETNGSWWRYIYPFYYFI